MRDLVLHLKSCYFREIKEGRKQFEFRLVKPYWQKRLVGKTYDRVIFWDAYKPGGPDTVIVFPWRGYEVQTIQHAHFGPDPVEVFAIHAIE
jgi:ASC-1-like (ASCH) protein